MSNDRKPAPIKTLYIVRHAKSAWSDPQLKDFDRSLNERGLRDAPEMARRFEERNEPIDLLVSSPAKRAITTALSFANTLGKIQIHEEPQLYLADLRTLFNIINALPVSAQRVMLVGHNPGLSELVAAITDHGIGEIPTCTTVRIDLHVDNWTHVATGTGSLAWWDTPKAGSADRRFA